MWFPGLKLPLGFETEIRFAVSYSTKTLPLLRSVGLRDQSVLIPIVSECVQ